jgi:hypothetical protein
MLHAPLSSVLSLCKLLVNFLHFVRTVRHFHANVHQTEIKNEKRKTGLFRDFCKTIQTSSFNHEIEMRLLVES